MSSPKYLVTYLLTTNEGGANPFWHASIMMSEQLDDNQDIEVKHSFGFYSAHPMSTTNPIIKFLKKILGFEIDLQDSHGHLEIEKIRHLEGPGLRGVTFDVPIEKYNQLLADFQKAKQLEKEAISEHTVTLRATEDMPVNGHTIWLKEQQSVNEGSPARLFPFHIDWTLSFNSGTFGLCISPKASTCKTRAVQFLRDADIIDEDFVHQILGDHELPRWGKVELPPLQLVSPEDRSREEKTGRDGQKKVYYNRSWEKGNHLFWASSPKLYNSEEKTITPSSEQHIECYTLSDVLKQINDVELLLVKRMACLQEQEPYYQQCFTQKERLRQVKTLLKANNHSKYNHHDALKMLNTARITLTPEKIDYNFLERAIENSALHHALLGVVAIVATASLISGVTAITLITCATAYSAHQFYKAIQKELETARMIADYQEFHATNTKTSQAENDTHLENDISSLSALSA